MGLTVLIVAKGLLLTQELTIACRRRPAIRIIGPMGDPLDIGSEIAAVDVAIVDLDEGQGRAAGHIELLRRLHPNIRVLGAGSTDRIQLAAEVLAAGGSGLVPRPASPAVLDDALRRAAAGELVLPDAHLAAVLDTIRSTRDDSDRSRGLRRLTARERQVLVLLAEGGTVADIASTLGIGPATVEAHVKSVLAKLDAHSRVEAVRFAWREGLARVPAGA